MEKSLVKQFHKAKINNDKEQLNQLFLEKAPKTLIKFYSCVDGSRIASLIEDKIWLANATTFNDPFDCVMNFSFETDKSISPQDRLLDSFIQEKLSSCMTSKCRSEWEKREESFRKKIGFAYVSCFSEPEQLTSLLMWAYYASGHKGYCVEYEMSAVRKGSMRDIFPINYSSTYVTQQLIDEKGYSQSEVWQFMFDYAFTKSSEWEHEKEWRIGHSDPNDRKGYFVPFVPPKNIYFGCKSSEEDILTIKTTLKDRPIGFYQMQPIKGQYRLEAVKIN